MLDGRTCQLTGFGVNHVLQPVWRLRALAEGRESRRAGLKSRAGALVPESRQPRARSRVGHTLLLRRGGAGGGRKSLAGDEGGGPGRLGSQEEGPNLRRPLPRAAPLARDGQLSSVHRAFCADWGCLSLSSLLGVRLPVALRLARPRAWAPRWRLPPSSHTGAPAAPRAHRSLCRHHPLLPPSVAAVFSSFASVTLPPPHRRPRRCTARRRWSRRGWLRSRRLTSRGISRPSAGSRCKNPIRSAQQPQRSNRSAATAAQHGAAPPQQPQHRRSGRCSGLVQRGNRSIGIREGWRRKASIRRPGCFALSTSCQLLTSGCCPLTAWLWRQFHATCLDTFPPIFYLNDVSRDVIRAVCVPAATSCRCAADLLSRCRLRRSDASSHISRLLPRPDDLASKSDARLPARCTH